MEESDSGSSSSGSRGEREVPLTAVAVPASAQPLAAWSGWGAEREHAIGEERGAQAGRWGGRSEQEGRQRPRQQQQWRGREASLAPWSEWGRGKLPPQRSPSRRPRQPPAQPPEPEQSPGPAPAREAVFAGVSERARAAALQFVFELKLRAFGSAAVHEQELRKHPSERLFLKVFEAAPAPVRPWGVRRVAGLLDGTMPEAEAWLARPRAWPLVWAGLLLSALLRGAGQAMLANSPLAGLLALAALAVSSPWLLVCSLFGLICATAFALLLGVNRAAVRAGLLGYNGLLLGGAVSVTLAGGDWNARALVFILFGALFTVVAVLALGNAWASIYGAPAFTFPFIVITWIMVACMHSSLYFPPVAALLPALAGAPPVHVPPTAGEFFAAWMSGCGQIYIAPSPYSGLLIVLGMACYSRISALAMLLGSLLGLTAAYMLGASSAAIGLGLWGYNPALFMIAIFGVFFVPSPKVFCLAVTGAFLSCFLSGALATVLRPLGVPQLTFAFSCSALCFVLVQFSLADVAAVPLAQVTTPESHWRKARVLRAVLRRLAAK